MSYIDIHSHILPCVDDGAMNVNQALDILKHAIKDGVSHVVLTPHYIHRGRYNLNKDEIIKNYIKFKKIVIAEGLDIQLFLGNELYINSDIEELILDKKVCSINNSRYVLVEFPFDRYDLSFDKYLRNIELNGYRVIIAHPERYSYVKKDVSFCEKWIREGYLLQCNQNSLFNELRNTTIKLITKGWVSFIASDAHGEYRPCELSQAYRLIEKRFSNDIAEDLFYNNAIKVLRNEDV